MARSRPVYEYTEAEDKSMRLGFLLIAAGLLSLLGLGCCWLRPALQERGGGGSANCTVLAVRQLGERFACTFSCGAACRGTARYPCLQVLVRTSRSSVPALLHEDERQLRTNPKSGGGVGPLCVPPAASGHEWEAREKLLMPARKCSYIPPCARDDQENSENVTYKQKYWKEKVGSQPFTCYFNQHLRPDDVMLRRTHDETVLLHCFLWPLVTFLVGVLIVVLTICAKSLAVRAEAIKKKKHL
ncbi:calcium-activated potassium channel subunit beta-4 isoform X1 [Cuculus canorus]|uniref:calcium-activated potassium channel subunit beta-4 isoform X1 n=1 Tax=Cuculus canorus TaxID=55661 RepID=UPI0023AB4142|nr:calcium-activated potassium channel subunit beta-4 isoform X1 [Cuculus canorus]